MGVFARLLRKDKPKSKESEEASTTEPQADTPTAQPGAKADAAEAAEEANEAAETEDGPAEQSAESPESESSDGVEIPKQQSTEEAADNEADEGARQ
jgi:hypothetical protein